MVRDGDVESGEVAAPPRPLPLPLARPAVGGAERAEQRDDEVLVEGIADEPYPLPPEGSEEELGVDAGEEAGEGVPGEGGYPLHVLPRVLDAVPRVAMERARGRVERGRRTGIDGPFSHREIT